MKHQLFRQMRGLAICNLLGAMLMAAFRYDLPRVAAALGCGLLACAIAWISHD